MSFFCFFSCVRKTPQFKFQIPRFYTKGGSIILCIEVWENCFYSKPRKKKKVFSLLFQRIYCVLFTKKLSTFLSVFSGEGFSMRFDTWTWDLFNLAKNEIKFLCKEQNFVDAKKLNNLEVLQLSIFRKYCPKTDCWYSIIWKFISTF